MDDPGTLRPKKPMTEKNLLATPFLANPSLTKWGSIGWARKQLAPSQLGWTPHPTCPMPSASGKATLGWMGGIFGSIVGARQGGTAEEMPLPHPHPPAIRSRCHSVDSKEGRRTRHHWCGILWEHTSRSLPGKPSLPPNQMLNGVPTEVFVGPSGSLRLGHIQTKQNFVIKKKLFFFLFCSMLSPSHPFILTHKRLLSQFLHISTSSRIWHLFVVFVLNLFHPECDFSWVLFYIFPAWFHLL